MADMLSRNFPAKIPSVLLSIVYHAKAEKDTGIVQKFVQSQAVLQSRFPSFYAIKYYFLFSLDTMVAIIRCQESCFKAYAAALCITVN